jgi:hypothetical protein
MVAGAASMKPAAFWGERKNKGLLIDLKYNTGE